MAAITYKEVLTLARQLDASDRIRLLKALLASIGTEMDLKGSQRSILELKGLGREIWQDINVDKYIQDERASWNG
ncbi:MAG: hypothetical protein PVH03_13360 [Chloroflexota bacterium]|jgi:hypothetical protein